MKNDKEVIEIVNKFIAYLDTEKEIYIKDYSKQKLKMVLNNLSKLDSDARWYKEIENRIKYLDGADAKRKKIIELILIIILIVIIIAMLRYSL